MDVNSLLLLLIAWLLWTIHQDLTESNDRARSLKTTLNQVAARMEQILGTRDVLGTSAAEQASTVNINSASKANHCSETGAHCHPLPANHGSTLRFPAFMKTTIVAAN